MDSLTQSEQRIFALGMLCATDGLTNIKVDYEQLAMDAGLKNGSTASVLFNKAKRKILSAKAALGEQVGKSNASKKASDGDKVTKTRTRKSPNKGKGKITMDNVDDITTGGVTATGVNLGGQHSMNTNADGTVNLAGNATVDGIMGTDVTVAPKPAQKNVARRSQAKGKGDTAVVKTELVDDTGVIAGQNKMTPIVKMEPVIKKEEDVNGFAEGIIEGTSYPEGKKV